MEFLDYVSQVDREEDEKVINKEKLEVGYLNQEAFKTCLERAIVGREISRKRGDKITALAIAIHREKYHEDDYSLEILDLQKELPALDIEAATKAGESPDVWN